MKLKINNTTIELVEGDITELETDAIVNPANAQLYLGCGVAGAIKTKAGSGIQVECDRIGPIEVGEAVITTGGDLKAKHVIHAVGPMEGEGDDDEKLRSATLNSLIVADKNNLKSIAFPAISTGVFGFPIDKCAEIMIMTIVGHLKDGSGLDRVVICLFDYSIYDVFEAELERVKKGS